MGKKFAVIGLGTAGIQSIAHYLYYLPNDWTVTSINNPQKPIVGIGESTNPVFITALENALDFNLYDELIEGNLNSTIKFGTYMQNWREKDFINPLIGGTVAIHLDTFKLQEFALPKFRSKWNEKFKELQGEVTSVIDLGDKVLITVDGIDHTFDYVMDCRGFPTSYDDYTVLPELTNHCLVHNVLIGSDTKATGHIATKDGWMFVVPLKNRTSYGYLFNDSITDLNTAKENFSKEINVPIIELNNIEYKFKPYYSNNIIKNRICLNGNKAVFFEPMFANSLFMYTVINRRFMEVIKQNNLNNEIENNEVKELVKNVYGMICYFYHGGSSFDTPFWNYVSFNSNLFLNNFPKYKKIIEEFKIACKTGDYTSGWVFTMKSLEIIDKGFNYNNFIRDNV
jgi:tryptophan halogenase